MDTPRRGAMMPVTTYLQIPAEQDVEQVAELINQLKEKSSLRFFVKNDEFGLISMAEQRLYANFTRSIYYRPKRHSICLSFLRYWICDLTSGNH